MKTWVGVGGLLYAAMAATLSSGAVVEFNKNFLATKSDRITFAANDVEPLRQNLLMTMEGYYSEHDHMACTLTETKQNSGTVTVLLAISKCLNESSIDLIEAWVDKIKDEEKLYFADGDENMEITFSTTLVPGACQARSEKNKKGFADKFDDSWQEGEKVLLSEAVQPGELDRIAAFARFGRVLDAVPTTDDDIPIAVISFVNDEKSFDIVHQYERSLKISKTFNFQLCQSGTSCEGHFKNCVQLEEDVDLFLYNPFTVVRSFQCDKLQDGIPVSFVDKEGKRQCFCTCPAGSVEREDAYGNHLCEVIEPETCPCTWSTHPYGFKIENEEPLETCLFKDLATRWKVPVPFPSDNYVADQRTNAQDDETDVENGPHIDVSQTQQFVRIVDGRTISQLMETMFAKNAEYGLNPFPPNFEELLALLNEPNVQISKALFKDEELAGFPAELQALLAGVVPEKEFGDKETVHYAWKDYQINREAKIDDLAFTGYGRYLLEVNAVDYAHSAQCAGCVAIVDKYRPQSNGVCPASFCDNTTSTCKGHDEATSELTAENLETANELVQAVYQFQKDVKNDACSAERCDFEEFSLKNFFEPAYCSDRSYSEDGPKCFDKQVVEHDFLTNPKAKENPLVWNVYDDEGDHVIVRQDRKPVPDGQCTRCCSYTTKLRELWTDYTCGYDYDMRSCSGLESEQCSFKQCLVLFGETMATAAARIVPTVAEESKAVIEKLVQKGFQTYTQIHRSLRCSTFDVNDEDCTFTAKVSDLIETQTRSNFETVAEVNSDEYVFWRYRVGDEDAEWKLFDGEEDPYTYTQAETKVTLEAWTQCGLVRRFFFYVHLHLDSKIAVCDKFTEMWYQSSVSHKSASGDLCAFPGSDFAEITFDYHPNVGLQYHRNELRMNVTGVVCSMSVNGQTSAEILNVQADSPEIVERFAVELANKDKTAIETTVHVECEFTYTRFDKTTDTQTCGHDFVVVDCNGPTFDLPDGECEFDLCSGQEAPGPFEACGGNVVKSNSYGTYLETEEVECCQACGETETLCLPILGLPDVDADIKRCVPQFTGNAYDEYNYETYENVEGEVVPQLLAASKAFVNKNAGATALLGASALVAIVALVVVRRRRRAAEEKHISEDAYYPLLH